MTAATRGGHLFFNGYFDFTSSMRSSTT